MKDYYLEIWLGTRWGLIRTFKRHGDALNELRERVGERYPMRIVRVERTVVFGEGKKARKKK